MTARLRPGYHGCPCLDAGENIVWRGREASPDHRPENRPQCRQPTRATCSSGPVRSQRWTRHSPQCWAPRAADWSSSAARQAWARPRCCGTSATRRRVGARPVGQLRCAVHSAPARTSAGRRAADAGKAPGSSSRQPLARTTSPRPSSDELTARAPTILVLEDLHWADEATLDVLRLLGRRVETVPALVLASYRDDELDRGHPLRVVLGELAAALRREPAERAATLRDRCCEARRAAWVRP